jgi:hypothetical protein
VVDRAGDAGGWLRYAEVGNLDKAVEGKDLNLPHDKNSVNYFPDFSPDGKYLVYAHAEPTGARSWLLQSKQELYVTRFPEGGVAVRITWSNAASQNPHWWGPPGAK